MARRYVLGSTPADKGTDSFTLIMHDSGFHVERHNDALHPSTEILPAADLDRFSVGGQTLLQAVVKKFSQITVR